MTNSFLRIIILAFLMLCPGLMFEALAENVVPSRTIHLVYDDSGSMIKDEDGVYVDTWCQAKYAMEVVAAMLGDKDTLRIYYMSDYDQGRTGEPMTIKGTSDPGMVKANVEKVHQKVTAFSNTPFAAVKRAGSDFVHVQSDENWLVILTDGEFDNISKDEVEKYYYQVAADPHTKVIMLAMGAHVSGIDADPERGVYFEHAQTSDAIRGKLTGICNRIFQRNALPEIKGDRISFGIPMSQLIVFAQGNDVQIGALTASDGTQFSAKSNVHASYSELAASNLPHPENVIINRGLSGQVATFDGSFNPGDYQLAISGADNIEVYYKPNVSISPYLYDEIGLEVTKDEKLVNGTYKIEFGFTNPADNSRVEDTSLLGNVDYTATIVNTLTDGSKLEQTVKSGDTISIRDGELSVDVMARFLEYNTVHPDPLNYTIYFTNELTWQIVESPTYHLTSGGFGNGDEPLIVSVQMNSADGLKELTQDQWNAMAVPKVRQILGDVENEKEVPPIVLGEFRVEKGDKPGTFRIYPSISPESAMQTESGVASFEIGIAGNFAIGDSRATGSMKQTIAVQDDIKLWERVLEWIRQHPLITSMFILVLLFLIGYGPQKKRLPKKLYITINSEPTRVGKRNRVAPHETEYGSYHRHFGSVIGPWPFVKKQTATIEFNEQFPNAEVRAGADGMELLNANDFEDIDPSLKRKQRVRYNWKLKRTSYDQNYDYTCQLSLKEKQ